MSERCKACGQTLPAVKAQRKKKRKLERKDGRYDARRAVRLALKAGHLVKGPCEYTHLEGPCSGAIGAHHWKGYSKRTWLKVKWCCAHHHHLADHQK